MSLNNVKFNNTLVIHEPKRKPQVKCEIYMELNENENNNISKCVAWS